MLNWFKGLLGSSRQVENPHRLPAELIDLMATSVSHLRTTDKTLPDKAPRYVIDGTDGDVLARMASVLPRWYSPHSDVEVALRAARRGIYDHWDRLPSEVLIRFGSVLAASWPTLSFHTRLDIAQNYPWIDVLIHDLTTQVTSHANPIHPMASMARLEALLVSAGAARSELVASIFRTFPNYVRQIPGLGESAARHADLLRGTFKVKSH